MKNRFFTVSSIWTLNWAPSSSPATRQPVTAPSAIAR